MEIEIRNADYWIKRLDKLSKAADGSNDMKPIYRAAGMAANRIWDNIFNSSGARFGKKWEQPAPITKILRARGKRRTFVSLYEAEHYKVKPLIDTTLGRKSFGRASGGGIFRVTGKAVMTGSKKRYMAEHNTGGSTKFVLNKQKISRFKRNFERKVNGEWNAEYFMLLYWMQKIDGKSFKLKRRQIEPSPHDITSKEMSDITRAMDHEMVKLEKRFGLI